MAEESPFTSFVPSTDPLLAGEPAKKARKKRTPKAIAPVTAAQVQKAVRQEAVKRVKKSKIFEVPKKVRAIKIDLSLAMTALAGLQEVDAKFVMGVVQAMQAFGKKQRARIVAALSKVFA